MDPNETLARMLRAASEIDKSTDEIERSMLADELACLVLAMNDWIKAGGFLPGAWVPARDTAPCPPPFVPNEALIDAARHGQALADALPGSSCVCADCAEYDGAGWTHVHK